MVAFQVQEMLSRLLCSVSTVFTHVQLCSALLLRQNIRSFKVWSTDSELQSSEVRISDFDTEDHESETLGRLFL